MSAEKPFEGKKVYFSGSVTNPHPDHFLYRKLIHHIKSKGILVLSEYVAEQDINSRASVYIKMTGIERNATKIRRGNLSLLDDSDCLIAVAGKESTGVGVEVQYVIGRFKDKKPVLCLVQRDVWQQKNWCPMVKGISKEDSKVARVMSYKDVNEAKRIITWFLAWYYL